MIHYIPSLVDVTMTSNFSPATSHWEGDFFISGTERCLTAPCLLRHRVVLYICMRYLISLTLSPQPCPAATAGINPPPSIKRGDCYASQTCKGKWDTLKEEDKYNETNLRLVSLGVSAVPHEIQAEREGDSQKVTFMSAAQWLWAQVHSCDL